MAPVWTRWAAVSKSAAISRWSFWAWLAGAPVTPAPIPVSPMPAGLTQMLLCTPLPPYGWK
eukprot:12440218-Alexandrium_andersonii.AAC.1